MGNFSFNVPSLGTKFVDYRTPILGDSFNWSWVHPLSEYQYLAIHHTAGPDTQTPDDIAAYHVNTNGWGGVGYHFIINKAGTVYYVGDLTTARAHVANLNHLAIGICLIGSFINGKVPTNVQLQSTHLLCAHLLFQTPELSQVDSWEDVVGHQQLGATACPGDSWSSWRAKIISGTGTPNPGADPNRVAAITKLYQVVLGREPDQPGLQGYVASSFSIEQIAKIMAESPEHQQLITKARNFKQAQTLAAEGVTLISQVYGKVEGITKL